MILWEEAKSMIKRISLYNNRCLALVASSWNQKQVIKHFSIPNIFTSQFGWSFAWQKYFVWRKAIVREASFLCRDPDSLGVKEKESEEEKSVCQEYALRAGWRHQFLTRSHFPIGAPQVTRCKSGQPSARRPVLKFYVQHEVNCHGRRLSPFFFDTCTR